MAALTPLSRGFRKKCLGVTGPYFTSGITPFIYDYLTPDTLYITNQFWANVLKFDCTMFHHRTVVNLKKYENCKKRESSLIDTSYRYLLIKKFKKPSNRCTHKKIKAYFLKFKWFPKNKSTEWNQKWVLIVENKYDKIFFFSQTLLLQIDKLLQFYNLWTDLY